MHEAESVILKLVVCDDACDLVQDNLRVHQFLFYFYI